MKKTIKNDIKRKVKPATDKEVEEFFFGEASLTPVGNIEAKKIMQAIHRKVRWSKIKEAIHLTASTLIIFFFLIWLSVLIQYINQQVRTNGYCEGTNCYLTNI